MGKETPDCECARCRELTAELTAAQQQLAAAQEQLAELSERLAKAKKNSSTSSKPPSSDIVKPKPPVDESNDSKRKIGGQPGHPKHEREPFPTEQITNFFEHPLDACPCCGGGLRRNGESKRVAQQMDVGEAAPLKIEQHTCPEYWCDHCQKPCWAPMPLRIQRGGLVGPNLTALIAFMKGFCHASYGTTRKFLRDVMGVNIGRSTLAKTIDKVSKALEGTYEELLDLLPSEDQLNIECAFMAIFNQGANVMAVERA
jgi:transposase